MAELEDFASDITAIRDGAWEAPGPEWGDMELKVRGFGPHWNEPLAKAQKEAVRAARYAGTIKSNQDWEDIPVADRNAINDKMLLKVIFMDVRNLRFGGEPVTAEKYRQMAQEPRFRDRLIGAIYEAANSVTTRRESMRKEAEGNSRTSSGSSLSGDSTPVS